MQALKRYLARSFYAPPIVKVPKKEAPSLISKAAENRSNCSQPHSNSTTVENKRENVTERMKREKESVNKGPLQRVASVERW